jgi:hypothetical protein
MKVVYADAEGEEIVGITQPGGALPPNPRYGDGSAPPAAYSGYQINVYIFGDVSTDVEAGGTIAAGDIWITATTDGKAVTATTGQTAVARRRQAGDNAIASGELFEVDVIPPTTAP